MREHVVEVEDDALGAPWAAARSDTGRRVVFVRKSDMWLVGTYCALGMSACPIFRALAPAMA